MFGMPGKVARIFSRGNCQTLGWTKSPQMGTTANWASLTNKTDINFKETVGKRGNWDICIKFKFRNIRCCVCMLFSRKIWTKRFGTALEALKNLIFR
jgi:hypothetical protein